MKESTIISTFKSNANPKLFDLINHYKNSELSTYIQDEKNKIWNETIANNKNCLHYTCEKGNKQMIVFILTQLKIRLGIPDYLLLSNNIENNNINPDLQNKINIFKIFINSTTQKEGYTPLHYLILSFGKSIQMTSKDNLMLIKFLIDNGADISINTKTNQNVLHLSCISNNTNALVLFKEKYFIDISSTDIFLKTPLHYCTEYKNYETLYILINYPEININCFDNHRDTPLHYAVKNTHVRAVKKLIQYLADINFKNNGNKSPYELGINSIDERIRNIFTKKNIFAQLFFDQNTKKGETNIYKMLFFIFIHIFFFILNYFSLMPYFCDKYGFFGILYIFLSLIIFIYYLILVFSNPGYKDKSNAKYSCLLDIVDDNEEVVNFCPLTFNYIEDDSRYCLICEKFITGFNHHCYWIGNCIGDKNFNMFLLFLLLCIINIGYNLILIITYFLFMIVRSIFSWSWKNNNNEKFDFFKGIRGCLGIIGILICGVFLKQIILLFLYHYKTGNNKRKYN